MKDLSYIGTSKKEQQRQHTLRKSRRLALKRRRQQKQRRTSVAEVLQLTPTRRHGNNLAQEAAEQLALKAALNDDQLTAGANKKRARKTRSSEGNHGGSTLADCPLPRDSEVATWFTKEESEGKEEQLSTESSALEEPNTEDRRFIISLKEGESDREYVPTDPEEFDYELSAEGYDFFKHPAKHIGEG